MADALHQMSTAQESAPAVGRAVPSSPSSTGGPALPRAERQLRRPGVPAVKPAATHRGRPEPPGSPSAVGQSSSPPLAGPSGSTRHTGPSPTKSHEASGGTRGAARAARPTREQHPAAPSPRGEWRRRRKNRPQLHPRRRGRADDPAVAAALNHQAAVLQNAFFPSSMIRALALTSRRSPSPRSASFWRGFVRDAGEPADAVDACSWTSWPWRTCE